MEKVFAIGDIHGSYELLEKLLRNWNPKEEQLVFLGDYIDRGPDSLRVIHKVMELSKKYEAITLSGNHEQIFQVWLDKPEEVSNFFFNDKVGGMATIQSFFDMPTLNIASNDFSVNELTDRIHREHGDIVKFLKQLRNFFTWDRYLFVHAGIDPTVEDFKQTKKDDYFWIREEFHHKPHIAKEIVVFGHTMTPLLNGDNSSRVWVSPCRKKIGIDGGGAIYENGLLHGLVFTKDSPEVTVHSASLTKEETTTTQIYL